MLATLVVKVLNLVFVIFIYWLKISIKIIKRTENWEFLFVNSALKNLFLLVYFLQTTLSSINLLFLLISRHKQKYACICYFVFPFSVSFFFFHRTLDSISLPFSLPFRITVQPFFIICIEATAISFKIKIYITVALVLLQYHTAAIYDNFRKDPGLFYTSIRKARFHFLFPFVFSGQNYWHKHDDCVLLILILLFW